MKDLTYYEIQTLKNMILKFKKYLNIDKIYDFTTINYNDITIESLLSKVNSIDKNINNQLVICDNTTNLDVSTFKNNIVIKLNDETGFNLNCSTETKISIHSKYFDYKNTVDNFKVLAIMHVYNEEDIIEQSIEYIINQGVDVYVIDNWSKDSTPNIISRLINKYPNRIFTEKFPLDKDNFCYDWTHQLQRTEELSKTLNYDWFIHYDVDEQRITPWNNITLKEMIFMVDKLGFNAIENTVINFMLTNKSQENIFMKDTFFEFGMRSGHFIQLKTWKKSSKIDLKSSGGHVAAFPNTRIYPLKILNKHYPFRSIEQASKKVFINRKQRFTQEEKNIGWHVQYDSIKTNSDLIEKDLKKLILWDDETINKYFVKLFIDARF